MRAQNIIGYLVLDEGRPVRTYPYREGIDYFSGAHSHRGATLFADRKAALRVKNILQKRYASFANNNDPNEDADSKSRFDLWLARRNGLRITAVVPCTEVPR